MYIIETPAYRKAFVQYLRKGTPLDVSFKAMAREHSETHYIWRTSGDDRVRASHAANNGRIFSWDAPPETGHPGVDYNCRCWAEPYYGLPETALPDDPPLESVYPEFAMIPLLRVPRLIGAWRAWIRIRQISRSWKLADYKSAQKWANRLEKGNWTPEKITHTIRYRNRYKAINKTRNNTPATRYQLEDEFVVVDDETNEIIQVSRPKSGGFHPNEFQEYKNE